MKKYTAPEIEIIKFRILEAIADDDTDNGLEGGMGPTGSFGAGDMVEGDNLPNRPLP